MYGINVLDCQVVSGTITAPNQYGFRIRKPTCGTANWQGVLDDTGDDTGLWFGGTGGVRAFASSVTQLELDQDLEVTGNGASYGSRSNIRYALMGA